MAKGQMRSNREVRKPKQKKTEVKAASALGSQVKQAASPVMPGGKKSK